MKRKLIITLLALILGFVLGMSAFAIAVNIISPSKFIEDDLTASIKPNPVTGAAADEDFIMGQTDFALSLLKNTVNEKNLFISPYSVMQILAMTANGADNETKSEMEQILGGIPIDKLNEYLYTLRTNQPDNKDCKLKSANSIWYRDDKNRIKISDSFLQNIADYYDASAFSDKFDDSTIKDINKWVQQNTDNMITDLLNNIDENDVMYLINAVAFDAKWAIPYEDYQVENSEFTAYDNTVQKAELMFSDEYYYLEDENASGFYKYYETGRYAFAALLPNEDITITEYIANLDSKSLYNTLSNPIGKIVETALPKFTYDYDVDFSDALKKLGMSSAFSSNADFSKMSDSPLYISRILQKTHVDVFQWGTKAAVVTNEELVDGCPPETEKPTVILNRPFVYFIVDTKTSLPIFMGTLMSIPE